MKFIIKFLILSLFTCLISVSSVEGVLIKKSNALIKAQTKGFNIASIVQLVKKYENFSRTNFGAFINGFFLGLIDTITAAKAEPTCTENKFWQVIQCFVGGADVALDAYYGDVGNFQNLPDNAEQSISEAKNEGDAVLNDEQVKNAVSSTKPAESSGLLGWLQVTWNKIQEKIHQAVDYIKGKITGFWNKAVMFFESPLVLGVSKIGKCVAPIAWEEIKEPALNTALTFLGVPWIQRLKNILLNAPLIIQKLKEIFETLKSTLTKTYTTTQQKYYNYGKATQDIIVRIKAIFDAARKLRRFRRLFPQTRAMRHGSSKSRLQNKPNHQVAIYQKPINQKVNHQKVNHHRKEHKRQ